jgi:hypothetical protein
MAAATAVGMTFVASDVSQWHWRSVASISLLDVNHHLHQAYIYDQRSVYICNAAGDEAERSIQGEALVTE